MFATLPSDHQHTLDWLTQAFYLRHDSQDAQALTQFAADYMNDHPSPALSGSGPSNMQHSSPKQASPERSNQQLESLYTRIVDCWDFIQRRDQRHSGSSDWEKRLQLADSQKAAHYIGAFPSAYREHFSPATALEDISHIEQLDGADDVSSAFSRSPAADSQRLHFKLFSAQDSLVLSDVVPILENLGMQVIGEHPYAVRRADGNSFWIHDFSLGSLAGAGFIERIQTGSEPLFQQAFAQVWHGRAENDEFNRLVVTAGISWREVSMLRAYARYTRQTRFGFSQPFIAESLARHTEITVLLVALFHSRFDPSISHESIRCRALETRIIEALERVESVDEDKILQRYLELIKATLRTNYFQSDANGQPKDYFSFKLDPSAISDLPLPLPKYEIFVYSPRIEGVHLRAGKVARGGLRWSDRSEDYRTEVLGLFKAQQVKNSVIVPMGAKGCFITKQLPPDASREQTQAEGIACYKIFIRGLLDITDNLVDGEPVAPTAVRRHDDDDPYLVVAADKGTATFSDIANGISEEYSFWLGDAFASGGSQGYDHKKMGITARGAWVSVKRHFRERNLNTQTDPFTVVGIGDMAGDVFGNGMLQSKTIELLAAFNHQHIFIDPNPNSTTAFAERSRLFQLPRSSWADYSAELISTGGGIFSRHAKWIQISDAMKVRFGITQDRLSPTHLINALLKAPVDMLWNGGIGTYVKSTQEPHTEVGDKANDSLRVDGKALRCQVLAEGGNLGISQQGRIEFALQGGAINTDFIDNAGGVDCSDHEVNIKILLNEQVAQGHISLQQRNDLLLSMTDAVARRVLHNNYRQVQALSIAEHHACEAIDEYIHLIDSMEAAGNLNRELEYLPSRQQLLERRDQGKGLTRPELSVLMSYTKIELKQALINSWGTEDPYLAAELEMAFPEQLVEAFPQAITEHILRKEIIATQVANDLVNRMGITYVHHLRQATGADHAQITSAYLIAREAYGIDARWQAIEALDNQVPADIQTTMMKELAKLVTRASWWLLRRRRNDLNISASIGHFKTGIEHSVSNIERLQQTIPAQDRWHAMFQLYTDAGVPELLSAYTAASESLYWLLDIIEIATELNMKAIDVSPLYFKLGEQLNLPWLDRQIRTYRASSHWQALARNSYRDDLDALQRSLTLSALHNADPSESLHTCIDTWLDKHRTFIKRWHAVLADMQSNNTVDCAIFTVAINVLYELA